MSYELISANDYDNLPDEPDMMFVEIDRICRRNMNEMINQDSNDDFDAMIRLQYMTTLAAAADELSIPGINYPHGDQRPTNHFNVFMLAVSGAVTRIRLRASSRAAPYSVRLSARTRGRIELQLRQLRTIVCEAAIPEDKRRSLLAKLDEFTVELNQTRLSFAKAMKILAAVSIGICGGTAFLADAPQAIATITSLIGADKEAEDAEAKRLGTGTERKLLPAPSTPQAPPKVPRHTVIPRQRPPLNDLDDDIPF